MPGGRQSLATLSQGKVLLISDQFAPSEHSAVEGIFGAGLPDMAETAVVEFARNTTVVRVSGSRAVLPVSCRRRGLADALDAAWPERHWDFVVVRNKFGPLAQVLAHRRRSRARVGLWLSFPHTYRRLHEAVLEHRAVWRKRVEYHVRTWQERRLLGRCDFFLPITKTLVREFHSDLTVPWLALPMGVDFASLGEQGRAPRPPGPLRLVYTGTVDALRRLDIIADAIRQVQAPVEFDIYSASDNAAVKALQNLGDNRIRLLPGRPRADLFEVMRHADVGVGLIPDTRLFRVSSPTKTLEYAALGLVPLLSPLPDYLELFDDRSAVFCEFGTGAIRDAVHRLAAMGRRELGDLGARACDVVRERRDYRRLAAELARFLRQLAPG